MAEKRQNEPVRGRGALIAALMKAQAAQETTPGPAETGASTSALPIARGRAALLQQLKRKATPIVGDAPSTTVQRQAEQPLEAKLDKMQLTDEPLLYKGESGKLLPASANYIALKLEPNQGVFEYEVKFQPDVDSRTARMKLMHAIIADKCRGKTFDGNLLYLPNKIIDTTKDFDVKHPFSDENVTVSIIFKKQKRISECIHLYNVLFKRIMYILQYLRIGRQFFDKGSPFMVPQHKLEIWPGYVTAVNEYSGGIMLCLDVQHRVLRTQNALEVMVDILAQDRHNYKTNVERIIIGSSVLTRYNNKSYIIHDIMWDASPASSFETNDGKELTFMEYYKKQYDINVADTEQPMLVTRQSINVAQRTKKEDRIILLVPELCFLTGLTDEMRSDFRIMKDIAQFTRITPNQRMNSLRKFINNVNTIPEATEVLAAWGLSLDKGTIDLHMRVLDPEVIFFGGDARFHGSMQADWTSAAMKNRVLQSVDFRNWLLICSNRDRRPADEFIQCILRLAPRMGINIAMPELLCVPDDRNETYVRILTEKISEHLQLVCIICPTNRDDRYATIKKICCVKSPIPSQVINAKTLKNPSKLSAITQKIALQMNCKLGGSLWTVRFPFKKWMICGIDVHHTAAMTGKTVCGFVTSINETISSWYSNCCFHARDREIGDHFKPLFVKSLMEFRKYNSTYPSTVVVYRDGVGDGDMEVVKNYEIPQFLSAAHDLGIELKLIYIIVQKRINTRIFLHDNRELSNPPPGSIVDHSVTKRNFFDFYLIAQQVRQGTVTPTHYTVLFDNTSIKADNVQRLTFKLCHMYYNWTGTIRVPAPCQYAHKLAFLIGQSVRAEHSGSLAHKLFYL